MVKEMRAEDFIISKTDTKGRITYVNKIFMEMAEYEENELLAKPHSILRNPQMPKYIFKFLWERVQNKEEIFAYVVNSTKNGNEYWVYANVTASVDEDNKIVGYYSVRRKPNPKALTVIQPLYKKMLEAEKLGGMEASKKILDDVCKEQGVSYDELIISLQE